MVSGRTAPVGAERFPLHGQRTSRRNVDTIKRSSNNVIDFMESEGYFRFKADYSISSKEFYDIYKQWCEDNACHSVSAIRFSAELRQNDRRYNLEATNNIYLPGGRRCGVL